MMAVPMDNSSSPSSRDVAESLYKKNFELENALRKSARSRVPSDPNIWSQMRENYEAIILEDHDFAEKHNVEFALWQLHYRKIKQFRAKINAARTAGSITAQGGSPSQPDHIQKICSVFKSFLSETTGFYHDLILKIKAKCGLPLSFFSEGPESQTILTKDEKKLSATQKGLMSCDRCLIYLGDIARYKGLYGEGDSVSRDFAAASSYYMQAASLCPSSGNPHHQLAILASHSDDDLMAVYRYFRSLAVDSPLLTARDNLIIAFEKNRQSFSQLPGNAKAVSTKTLVTRSSGRCRGRGGTRLLAKDVKTDASSLKQQELSIPEIFKAFSTRFVRLNGILFTRTSLEMFGEVLSLAISNLLDLLSSGPGEVLNCGPDAAENGLLIVRLISILIFTVHNVNKKSENQSNAEVLQRTVLLQNALTAAFEFAGHIINRCIQLDDVVSSYFLPAILVFIEWLACHPDIAVGSDVNEQQVLARSFFWSRCVILSNKLVASGIVYVGDEDESCFFDMSQYDDGETDNRLALWEDFELRGFLPLVPAQLILDFSRKYSLGSDGNYKENRARVQRILAAVRVLMNVVQVDQKGIYFDDRLKKFVISAEAPASEDFMNTASDTSKSNIDKQASPGDTAASSELLKLNAGNLRTTQLKPQLHLDGDEEDEEIVFKPMVTEKLLSESVPLLNAYETIQAVEISSKGDWPSYSGLSALNNFQASTTLHAGSHATSPSFSRQPLPQMNVTTSKWIVEQEALLSDGLKNMNINGNGLSAVKQEDLGALQSIAFSPMLSAPSNINATSQTEVADDVIPSTFDSIMPLRTTSGDLIMKATPTLQTASRKQPISRPARHFGPPPGFDHVSSKQLHDSVLDSALNEQYPQIDDYSWLDGHQSASTKSVGWENIIRHAANAHSCGKVGNTNMLNDAISFPFPGKQVSAVPTQVANEKKWQDFQLLSIPNHIQNSSFSKQIFSIL